MAEPKRITTTLSSMPPFEEYVDEIRPLWESHWLSNWGSIEKRFIAQLNDYLHCPEISLYDHGHSAIEAVIESLELTGEVITTPFTFASTTHAIVRRGLTPVFADVKADDFTIDPASVERCITPRTSAILAVHVYGNLCDDDSLREIADRHGIKLLYDAAHAFGVEKDGVPAACLGDASMFSFHATKAFHTIEGGAACIHVKGWTPEQNHDFRVMLDQKMNFGTTGKQVYGYVGPNNKMNEFEAAMGICNLRHLDEYIDRRRAAAERYWERLGDVAGINLCRPKANTKHNFVYMPAIFDQDVFGASRDQVQAALLEDNISCAKYFYPLTNDLDCYRGKPGFDPADTPVAMRAAAGALSLPLSSYLTTEDVDRVCDIVLSCAGR